MYISEKALCGFLNWFHGMEMFQLCHLYATKGYQHILPNFLYQNPLKFQQVPVVSREATSDRKVLILFFFFQFLHFRSLFILSPLPTGIWYSGKMCALNIAVNRGTMREVTWSGEMTGGGERSQPPLHILLFLCSKRPLPRLLFFNFFLSPSQPIWVPLHALAQNMSLAP